MTTMVDLIPWTDYEFRVIATNTLGTGDPSNPSPIVKTLEAGKIVFFFYFGHLNIRRNKESEQLNRSRSGREKKRCGTTVQLSVLLFIHHHSIIALFTYVKYHWRNESA